MVLVLESVFRGESVFWGWCNGGEGCGVACAAYGEADISRRKEAARGTGEENGDAERSSLVRSGSGVAFLAAFDWSNAFRVSFCVSSISSLRLRS